MIKARRTRDAVNRVGGQISPVLEIAPVLSAAPVDYVSGCTCIDRPMWCTPNKPQGLCARASSIPT